MRTSILLFFSIGLLTGCNGLDRLISGQPKPRGDGYDASPVLAPIPRTEPYGVMVGYRSTGEKLYLIHWTGSNLDNTSMLESEVNLRGYPKYSS